MRFFSPRGIPDPAFRWVQLPPGVGYEVVTPATGEYAIQLFENAELEILGVRVRPDKMMMVSTWVRFEDALTFSARPPAPPSLCIRVSETDVIALQLVVDGLVLLPEDPW